jgi:aspartate/methionine/tyrosine aminotransferase
MTPLYTLGLCAALLISVLLFAGAGAVLLRVLKVTEQSSLDFLLFAISLGIILLELVASVGELASNVRTEIRSAMDAMFAPKEAGLLLGLALGDTSELDPGTERDFQATGLTHLLAVSGGNVAMVLAPVFGLALVLRVRSSVRLIAGLLTVMFFVILALVDPGDEVLYPNPGFPIYESMIRYIGGVPVPVRLVEEKGFALDVDQLCDKVGPKTRLIILNYPHNPTGGVISEAGIRAIADVAVKHGVPVLSDEIYARILYEAEHKSIAAMPGMEPLAIVLDGFSKTYAMTGWRMGYGIMPAPMAQVVAKLQTNATSCTATFTQIAGVAALRGDQGSVERMVVEFRRRRDTILEGLSRVPGVQCARPRGAFYVFPNITGTGYSSRALADKLLDEAGVACLSGTAFGEFGEGYLRFSYANSLENIEEAVRRIRALLN